MIDGQYHCEFCDHKTNQKGNLITHKIRKHRDLDVVKALIQKLDQQKSNRSKKTCSFCGWKGVTMKKHKTENHPGVNKDLDYPDKCSLCTYKTYCVEYLVEHLNLKHDDRVGFGDLQLDDVEKLRCVFCNFHFTVERKLKEHMMKQHRKANKEFLKVILPS